MSAPVALLAVVLLTACTSPVGESKRILSPNSTAASASADTKVEALVALATAVSSDFEPARSLDELSRLSEVVLSGEVIDISDGPISGRPDDHLGDIQLVIVQIGGVEVVHGSLPPSSDGNVYLSIVAPMGAARLNKALPPGTPVGLYGAQIVNMTSDGDIPLTNAGAGRPEGQPVYRAAHPQGLVFQIGDRDQATLVWPQAQYSTKGLLTEALPGGNLIGFSDESEPVD